MASALRYQGKVTIVTGGARGIGRGIVDMFVRHGSSVVFCDVREELGKDVEKAITGDNPAGEVVFVKCDMTVEAEIQSLVDTTVEKFGHIDCVVNNAGWHPPSRTIDDFSGDDMLSLLKLNLVGPFLLCKFAMPFLRQVAGNIINMASIDATLGKRESVTYDATKGGLWTMTRAIACDEGKHGVRANTVSPGHTNTELAQEYQAISSLEDPDSLMRSWSVLQRTGTVEEVAAGCLYLAAEGTFCTGMDLKISGGTEIDFAPKLGSAPVQLKYKS